MPRSIYSAHAHVFPEYYYAGLGLKPPLPHGFNEQDTWSMDWRSMHTQMWDSYSHAFRHAYLQVCGGTAEGEAS